VLIAAEWTLFCASILSAALPSGLSFVLPFFAQRQSDKYSHADADTAAMILLA
jgi:hypothetical protein